MVKLIESLIGSASQGGSRRVQLAAIGLLGIVTMPDLAWPIVAVVGLAIAGLTITDATGTD